MPAHVTVTTSGVVTGGGGPPPVNPVFGTYNCDAGLAVGQWVQIDASDHVIPADADDGFGRPAVGVVVAKPTAVIATVQTTGECAIFAGLTVGKYWLDDVPGAMTNSLAGLDPGDLVQKLGNARNATTFVINISMEQVVKP